MNNNIKPIDIFQTPIWHLNILNEKYNDDLKNIILQKSEQIPSVRKTNNGGWQSDDIKNEKIFKPLFVKIGEVMQNLQFKVKDVLMAQAWCNVNFKNNWNVIHNHGQYNFSAVYFVQKPKESGELFFRDPRAGLTAFWGDWADQIYKMYGQNAILSRNFMKGDLIIFPGYLDHFVEPSQSDEPRISIAADLNLIYHE